MSKVQQFLFNSRNKTKIKKVRLIIKRSNKKKIIIKNEILTPI